MSRSNRLVRRAVAPAVGVLAACMTATAPDVLAQAPATWSVSPDPVVMGSGADELFEAVRFGRILPDGRVVVADARGLFLRLYGPEGERLEEIGRPGDGPGEFRGMQGLWLTPDGGIGVWDPTTARLTIFESDGRLVGSERVRAGGELAPGNLEVFLGRFSDGDVLLGSLQLRRRADVTPERWVLGRFGPEGAYRGSPGEIPGMWRARRAPLPFSPVPRVAIPEDSIWVAAGYEPVIRVLGPEGEVGRTIRLPWTVRPSDDPWATLRAELEARDERFHLELLEEVPRTERFPPVGGLLVGDAGRLWVKVYDPSRDALWLKRNALEVGPGGEWRVLAPDGEWVATVRMPDDLIPLDIRGDRLLGVSRDELDVERVVVHRLER